jgi:transcriptional regulator with XRE-family HTH domain
VRASSILYEPISSEPCGGEWTGQQHVSERFLRLLDLYRRPDGSEWGGQDLENATGGAVTRSYVANLKNGRISSPGLAKMEAIANAMGFPPELWFGPTGEGERVLDEALVAALEDDTVAAIPEQVMRLSARDRRLLLGIARQISSPPEDPPKAIHEGDGGT